MDNNEDIKIEIKEYIAELKTKWFNYWTDNNISKLQRNSEILCQIEFWVKEILIEDIENNGIDNEEDFESYFNQEYCHISTRFMEYFTETHTLLIKHVDDIMCFVRNEIDDYIYESDYYEEIKECFYKQFDITIYTIAKKMWDCLSEDIIKFKQVINMEI